MDVVNTIMETIIQYVHIIHNTRLIKGYGAI